MIKSPLNTSHRCAYSLVELLAVVLIISILAAIALPTVKNVLVERKTSVAAIEIKGFLEAARTRAIARGRSVSVILERLGSRAAINPTTGAVTPIIANPTPSLPTDNFDVYNSCIRITMAESNLPVEFIVPNPSNFASQSDLTVNIPSQYANSSKIFFDASGGTSMDDLPPDTSIVPPVPVPEYFRILQIANFDPRLADNLIAGNDILISQGDAGLYRFAIKAPLTAQEHRQSIAAGKDLFIAIENEGTDDYPWGSQTDINAVAARQGVFTPFRTLDTTIVDRFYVAGRPRPIASTATELPRGTCIDLSLSGLASDDPNANPSTNAAAYRQYHDCRRQFASDWCWPRFFTDGTTLSTQVQTPDYFRPVYLTFSSSGTLESILCNGPFQSSHRRIEPHADVCLFVGRLDQVIPIVAAGDLVAAQDASLKANLLDDTGYWIRISPSSGAVVTAPALTSHIQEDIEDFRAGTNNEAIGLLLDDSRTSVFTSEGTSQ